jgi:hypothetical protein
MKFVVRKKGSPIPVAPIIMTVVSRTSVLRGALIETNGTMESGDELSVGGSSAGNPMIVTTEIAMTIVSSLLKVAEP